MAEYDNKAFNAMQNVTKGKASKLFAESGFTESAYNTQSTDKERGVYDREAYGILREMYDADSAKNKFKDIDFNRYLELLKPSLFEERVLSREGDQKMGDFFLDIYEGDFDQLKASAMKYVPSQRDLKPGDPGFDRRAFDPKTGRLLHTRKSSVSGRKVSY